LTAYLNNETSQTGSVLSEDQIIISMDDANTTAAQIALTQMQFEQLNTLLFDADGNSRLFFKDVLVYPQVPLLDSKGQQVEVNDEPILVNLTSDYVITQGVEFQVPIVLTPTQNNEGTLEEGFTGDGDDTIVAGRLELLHQAYIDGGAGRDTLEIHAKGYFAQPLQLLNIEQINIQNLPNVYTLGIPVVDDPDPDNGQVDVAIYDIFEQTAYPDLANNVAAGFTSSVIDLSTAIDLDALTITEGDYEGLLASHMALGTLTVTGIRNGAETTLDGNFANNLKLNFGEMQGKGVKLIFNNLSMEDTTDNSGSGDDNVPLPLLKVAHNAETLSIKSTGGGNFLHHADLGGLLSTLNISGDAHLYIAGDLAASMHAGTPVTINAADNTGGVNLTLGDDAAASDEVTFIGSQGNDRFTVNAGESVNIEGGAGNNAYDVSTITAIITNTDGNNVYDVTATVAASFTVGNGDNEFNLTVTGAQAAIVAGDGDNVISAEGADAVVIEAGDGANDITTDGSDFVDITAGDGDNQISSVDSGWVAVQTGDGNNEIEASAEVIDITTGAGNDQIVVSGTGDPLVVDGEPTALLMINTGTGEDTVVLGRDYDEDDDDVQDGVIALEGSSITGENITLYVDNPSDLRAAELSGISSVVLNSDVSSGEILTLTASQFAAIGAENFSVDGSIFHTHAYIKIIAQEDVSLTDLGVDDLPSNIDLYVEINDDVTVTMTAEQLHKWVAEDGVILADDGNTDDLSGSVLITNAGLDFDPFNSDDQVRTEIGGTKYLGGSLSDDFGEDTNDTEGIQRDEWGANVLVDRVYDGYNRPADSPSYSRLTIDTDVHSEIGPFATIETFLRVIGDSDLTFTPVDGGIDDFGRPIEPTALWWIFPPWPVMWST